MTLAKFEALVRKHTKDGWDDDIPALARTLHAAWEREHKEQWGSDPVMRGNWQYQKERADAAEARVKELEQTNHNLRMENEQLYQASAEIQTMVEQIENENTDLKARLAALREALREIESQRESWYDAMGDDQAGPPNEEAEMAWDIAIAALATDEEGREG